MKPTDRPVYVQSVGLVCSLGLDIENAAAAWRAGLSRAGNFDSFTVKSGDDGSGVGVTAHEVPLLSHGFEGITRLQNLLQGAFEDLVQRLPEDIWNRRIGVILVLPSPRRRFITFNLLDDESERKISRESLEKVPELTPELLHPIFEKITASVRCNTLVLQSVVSEGQTGFISAIAESKDLLNDNMYDTILVGCVDSMLDENTLNWLESLNRLKTSECPVGLQPGEGAAFIALSMTRSESTILSIPTTIKLEEKFSYTAAEAPQGHALSACIEHCLQTKPSSEEQKTWVVNDFNGEVYRAQDWGSTLARVRVNRTDFQDPLTWYPAIGIGDVGAAFPGIAIGFIEQSYRRGYALNSYSVLCLSVDQGYRGGALICKVEE